MTSTHRPSHHDPHHHRETTTPTSTTVAEQDGSSGPGARAGWVIVPTPMSVWITGGLQLCLRPGHRVGFGEPPCAWRWSDALWEAIITAYSRPGDRVRVSDAGHGTVVPLALAAGRRITAPVPRRRARTGLRFTLLDSFPRQVRTRATLLPDSWSAPAPGGPADLLIITPPCPDDQPTTGPASTGTGSDDLPAPATDAVLAHQLAALTQAAGLVRAGGVVAVLTRITPDQDGATDRIGPLITHARMLGLRYLQHNPIIHATVTDGRINPHFGPDDPVWHRPHPADGPAPWTWATRRDSATGYDGPAAFATPALHMPVHSDLVVFTQITATDTATDAHLGGAQ